MNASLRGHYAGFISRLLAFGIDLVVVTVTLVATGWILTTASSLFASLELGQIYPLLRAIIVGIGALVITAGYFILFWTAIGQTPGKILLGVRIVRPYGQPISFWQAIIRYLGYLLSTLVFFLGFAWILVDNHRQGWHDKLARTVVIYDWDARPGRYLARRTEEARASAPSSEETPA